MLNVKQEAVNTNFRVIALTRLGIKSESIAPEAKAFTIRLSELLKTQKFMAKLPVLTLKTTVHAT